MDNTDTSGPLYSWLDFHDDARALIAQLRDADITITAIVAIPRGGLVLGVVLSHAFTVPLYVASAPEGWMSPSTLVVDDNARSGDSLTPFAARGLPCAVLVRAPNCNAVSPFFAAREDSTVFLFPWEVEAAREPIPLQDVVYADCDEPPARVA